MANYLLPIQVAVGGVIGAALRYLVTDSVSPAWLGLILVNIAGSLLIGWLVGQGLNTDHRIWGAVGVGFCGGLTSFSSFSLQVANYLSNSQWVAGLSLAVFASVFLVVMAGVGYRVGARR